MPVSSKEFLDIQATIEYGFTLKRVRDMIKKYSQQDFWCAISYNSESRKEKMSEVKNIHAAKIFNTFSDHTIHTLGLKKMQK